MNLKAYPPGAAVLALATFSALIASTAPAQAPQSLYSHGEPTAAEQQTLQLINRARRDPVAESYRLAAIADWDLIGNYYHWTREAFLGEFRGLAGNGHPARACRPQQPLAFNPVLLDAARRQNAEQVSFVQARRPFVHRSGDGLTSLDYAFQAGYQGGDGENLSVYRALPGTSGVADNENALLFEINNADPQLPLGHRYNLLGVYNGDQSRAYGDLEDSEIGVAVDHRSDGSFDLEARTDCVGAPSDVYDFQTDDDVPLLYVTGVVFEDRDIDGHYTPGEGLAGVLVQPDHGFWRAVTSASGGYAIPLCPIADAPFNTAPGAGLAAGDTVTLTFSGGPLRASITRTLVLPGHSVEINVAQPQVEGAPGAKRPALSAAFTPETGLVPRIKPDGSTKATLQGALRLTNLGKKNTGTFRVVLLVAAPGGDGTDLTGATPLAELDVTNVGKKAVLDLPLSYKVKNASGRVVVALVDVLETVGQTGREGLRPTLMLR